MKKVKVRKKKCGGSKNKMEGKRMTKRQKNPLRPTSQKLLGFLTIPTPSKKKKGEERELLRTKFRLTRAASFSFFLP